MVRIYELKWTLEKIKCHVALIWSWALSIFALLRYLIAVENRGAAKSQPKPTNSTTSNFPGEECWGGRSERCVTECHVGSDFCAVSGVWLHCKNQTTTNQSLLMDIDSSLGKPNGKLFTSSWATRMVSWFLLRVSSFSSLQLGGDLFILISYQW